MWLRVTWMGYVWSFRALGPTGKSIPNDRDSMAVLADFVTQELRRWMAEDAPDTPPFDVDACTQLEQFSLGRNA